MNKGLDLIQRQQIETIDGHPTGNVYIGLTFEELAELEKELKALEIINNKCVNVGYLKDVWKYNAKVKHNEDLMITANTIKQLACGNFPEGKCLTQEEYELLKEVLL